MHRLHATPWTEIQKFEVAWLSWPCHCSMSSYPPFLIIFDHIFHNISAKMWRYHMIPVHDPAFHSRSFLILSHLCICHPLGFFLSALTTKTLCSFLFSSVHATYLTYLILDMTVWIFGEEYIPQSLLLYIFLHSSVTSFLLSLDIFLSTVFVNTLSLYASLNAVNQTAQPCKTAG